MNTKSFRKLLLCGSMIALNIIAMSDFVYSLPTEFHRSRCVTTVSHCSDCIASVVALPNNCDGKPVCVTFKGQNQNPTFAGCQFDPTIVVTEGCNNNPTNPNQKVDCIGCNFYICGGCAETSPDCFGEAEDNGCGCNGNVNFTGDVTIGTTCYPLHDI